MTLDLTRLAFRPFLLCVWLLKTFGFTPGASSHLQMEMRGQPASYKGPDSKYSLLCEPHDLCRKSSTLHCGGDAAVDGTHLSLAGSQFSFVCGCELHITLW